MERSIAPLPYAKDALEPYLSALTVEVHYERHHRAYLKKLQELVEGRAEQDQPLEALIRSANPEIAAHAAQLWNHDFLWKSLKPGGSRPGGELLAAIERDFGGPAELKQRLVHAGVAHFGSGWLWLALDFRQRLKVVSTRDAETALRQGGAPLLAVELWEHAYCFDYFDERGRYVENVVEHLLDWDFAAENLRLAQACVEQERSGDLELAPAESWRGPERSTDAPIPSAP